jgi:hypothetical protein
VMLLSCVTSWQDIPSAYVAAHRGHCACTAAGHGASDIAAHTTNTSSPFAARYALAPWMNAEPRSTPATLITPVRQHKHPDPLRQLLCQGHTVCTNSSPDHAPQPVEPAAVPKPKTAPVAHRTLPLDPLSQLLWQCIARTKAYRTLRINPLHCQLRCDPLRSQHLCTGRSAHQQNTKPCAATHTASCLRPGVARTSNTPHPAPWSLVQLMCLGPARTNS